MHYQKFQSQGLYSCRDAYFYKKLKLFRDGLKTDPNDEILFNSIFLQKKCKHRHKGSLEVNTVEAKL